MKVVLILLTLTISSCFLEDLLIIQNPEVLIKISKDGARKSQIRSKCSMGEEKEAWDKAYETWNKALVMAQKSEKGMADPNWDSKLWKAAHNAWSKAVNIYDKRPEEEKTCPLY